MNAIQRKFIVVLLTGLLLFTPMLTFNVPSANAITAEQIEQLSSSINKLSKLTPQQAQAALRIAKELINSPVKDIIGADAIDNLKAMGLTKAEVITIVESVENQVNWQAFKDASNKLAYAVVVLNDIRDDLNASIPGFTSKLAAKGITIEDLVGASLEVVTEVSISSWDNIPKNEIESIFKEHASNPEEFRRLATKYGLNWQSVDNTLAILKKNGDLDVFKDILVTLGNWTVPSPGGSSGGGGGATTDKNISKPVGDTSVKDAITQAATTGRVTINAPAGEKQVALTVAQFKSIQETGKPMQVNFGAVSMVVSPNAIPASVLGNATQIQFAAQPVSQAEAAIIAQRAANSGLFRIAGEVFELSVTAVVDGKLSYVRNFDGKIQVSLPVPANAKALAAQGKLTVCRYNEETKAWEDMSGTYDAATGTISFETDRFSKYAVMEVITKTATFNDIAGHWAQADIEFMASEGLANGIGNGQFAPDANITRAQFAAFLVRVLGVPETTGTLSFSDVSTGAWYYNSLATAYKVGLIKGVSADEITPNDNITREQMAVMIVRAMEYKGKAIPSASDLAFADKSAVAGWATTGVSQCAQLGLVGGFPDGTFAPQANATRAQAIVILHRIYNQIQ